MDLAGLQAHRSGPTKEAPLDLDDRTGETRPVGCKRGKGWVDKSSLWLRREIASKRTTGEEHNRLWKRRLSPEMAVALSWSSAFRVALFLLLLAGIAVAFTTLPAEKTLKDFLLWVKLDLGPWGPLALAIAYIPLTILAVPASILSVKTYCCFLDKHFLWFGYFSHMQLGGGYLFGLPVGFLADSLGATIGATAAFLLGKSIGRSYVISKLNNYPKFQAVAIAIQRSGFKVEYVRSFKFMQSSMRPDPTLFKKFVLSSRGFCLKIVLLLRLAPLLPFNLLNYFLAVTPIHLGEYILASWLGMMPITFALVYIGTTLKDLSDVTNGWPGVSMTHWVRHVSL
ncbi:unnamed protein product [Thlaspi arvense]|uniref:VTT domain-containing protein n=1 Tax=Thlaspi arvense TaxID=13288 RepID=A0AAU9RIF1_THLAR|nr:unnamed protein product [Thlaspi arvense]